MRELKQIDALIGWAEQQLRQHPDMTGADLLSEIRALRTMWEGGVERATCRHCGYPIYQFDGRWKHEGESANVGCRAASFDRLGTWDDSLDGRWNATPAIRNVD